MVTRNTNRRAGDAAARQVIRDRRDGPARNSQTALTPQAAIRADLIGDDACTVPGLTARGAAPVLALCRRLIEAGHDPALALEVYRGNVLALAVRSIGEGAGLEVNNKGSGFVRSRTVRTASPMRQNGWRMDTPSLRAPAHQRGRATPNMRNGRDGGS